MAESTTITIPGITDYSFVLPASTESLVPTGSSLRIGGNPAADIDGVGDWRASAPVLANADGRPSPAITRINNIVADALAEGWQVTATVDSYGHQYDVVLSQSPDALAALLWVFAHRARSGERLGQPVLAVRLRSARNADGDWRFDSQYAAPCYVSPRAADDEVRLSYRWAPRDGDGYTQKALRTVIAQHAPATVLAAQQAAALTVVQQAADTAASEAAVNEYARTGRQQFDALRRTLSDLVDEAAKRTESLAEAAGRSFAQGYDSGAAEQRLRSRGWAHVGEWVASALAHEGDSDGGTGVRTLGAEIAETLSTFADYGLGRGGDRSPEYAEAYRILSDALARVARVSRVAVTVTV